MFATSWPRPDPAPPRSPGLRTVTEDLAPALEAIGCYRRRDEAIRAVFPEYGDGWRSKLAIAGGGGIRFFNLVVESPQGEVRRRRLPPREYLQIVAATNYKQRMRKAVEYY